MTIYRKTTGGTFAPVSQMSIRASGAFQAIKAAWVNDNGQFKKVFGGSIQYEDPTAYYDVENATPITITEGRGSETSDYAAWIVNDITLPQREPVDGDADWTYYEYFVIDTGEILPVDMFSTGGNQPTASGVKYENASAWAVTEEGTMTKLQSSNPAIIVRNGNLAWESGYQYFKVQRNDALYANVYGKPLGLRLRWHSMSLDKYFEYVFTDESFVLTSL